MNSFTRFMSIFVLVVAILSPSVANASYQEGDFRYTFANNEATITGYEGPSGDVVIPSTLGGYTVTRIGNEAFSGYASLTGITIPDTVTHIGDAAFLDCTGLSSITIPNSVTSFGYWRAFIGCTGLTNIAVDLDNAFFSSLSGVLFNKDQTVLIEFPGGITGEYVVPESVTRIGDFAFDGAAGLTSVKLSASTYRVGDGAFGSCTGLTEVTFSHGLLGIGDGAFANCTSLKSITIPANVFVGAGAFSSCTNLTSVYIGANTSLDSGVFWLCSNLRTVNFMGNEPTHFGGSDTFHMSFPTIYRRFSTTGWGDVFLGRPVRIWPEITQIHASQTGISFRAVASPNQQYVVAKASCLLAKDWTPVYTGIVTEGESLDYDDPDVNLYSQRFYRIVIE